MGCTISRSPAHLPLKPNHLQISQGRGHRALYLHEASQEPRSLWVLAAGGTGSPPEVPLRWHLRCHCRLSGAATWQPARQPWSGRFPGRVGVRMNNGCTAALGSGTTDSQHRNYSRHKENTNKDPTQQRDAGISQQK